MISHRKNIQGSKHQPETALHIVFMIMFSYCSINAGVYTNDSFPVTNNGIHDSGLTYATSLQLGAARNVGVKIFGDSLQPAAPQSLYSDVISCKSDTFTYFYVQDNLIDGVYRRDLRITGGFSASLTSATKVFDFQAPSDCYLHADKGESGFLVSVVRNGAGQHRVLHLSTGTAQADIDSSVEKEWLFSTQCHLVGDTFCVVYSNEMASVLIKKVYAKGNVIQVISTATVSTDTVNGMKLMNCSVTADGQGNILVAWIRGAPVGNKKIHVRHYTSNLAPVAADSINQNIGEKRFYYYDDIGTTSIDIGKFAIAHWDTTGLWISTLLFQNGTINKTTTRVINRPGLRHTTIASNKKFCVVACIGDADGDGYAGVEGLRYEIKDGILLTPVAYSYSRDVNIIPDIYSCAINCALDTSGDFALSWEYQNRIQGTAWVNRIVRNRSGFWVSPVESLAVTYEDSVRFYPAAVAITSLTSWSLIDSIRRGSTIPECSSAPWISLSSESVLQNDAAKKRFFQYRMTLVRNQNGDSLTTPGITAISIPWNAQPSIEGIDSVLVGEGTYAGFGKGQKIITLSRKDSIRIKVRIRDSEQSDSLYLKGSFPVTTTQLLLTGDTLYTKELCFAALQYDTTVQCTISTRDSKGWNAVPGMFDFECRNSLPQLTVSAAYDSSSSRRISRTVNKMDTILIHEYDSLEITYSIADSNDQGRVAGYLSRNYQGTITKLDSIKDVGQRKFVIRGDTAVPSYSTTFTLSVNDPDTSFSYGVLFSINHTPQIDSVLTGNTPVKSGDTARVIIGKVITVKVIAHDTDCAFGDTLKYRFRTANMVDSISSTLQKINYNWTPRQTDSSMTIIITDRYGKSDTSRFFLKFPWLEMDSTSNRPYYAALDTLANVVSLIIDNPCGDTVTLPIVNNGKDTLLITSMTSSLSGGRWIKVGVPYDSGLSVVDFIDSQFTNPINIPALSQKQIKIYFSTSSLKGDGNVRDTLILATNDFLHTNIKIPIHMEYNDLPKIVSVNPDFVSGLPWRLRKVSNREYVFPPHATISVLFSEPMDTGSVKLGMFIYSVLDSQLAGKRIYIPVRQSWSQQFTKLNCAPVYDTISPTFGFQPSEGLFIPTDLLAVRFTGQIVDRATTRSGPNRLDINLDNYRDIATADSTLRMKVDSIGFSILSISPVMFDTQIVKNPKITLTFSAPVYASSVDTSLIGNRSLMVRSKYNNSQQLTFDSIAVSGNSVTFRIARKLFYYDSLWCWYNSRTILNSTGFPSDNNRNGISIAMYDTLNVSDDVFWSYRVKSITVDNVQPASLSNVKEITPEIIMSFSDTVNETIFDTDTTRYNRSFQVRSKYGSESSAFQSIEFFDGGKTVRILPKRKFFSKDSIYCRFFGFKGNHLYTKTDNIPVDTFNNFSAYDWSFYTGNTGFYTYPNPYKPAKDPRHCSDHGPCGIWFKNLHILKEGVFDVHITILSMNTHTVFDSKKAGLSIHFESSSTEHLPQWLWDTRNQMGDLVASGIYFYTVKDIDETILTKGKLMIVR